MLRQQPSTGQKGFISCTPYGIIQLLKRSNIDIAGKHCVVIGRSNIVGKPMSMLLLRENGTVTVVHSKTQNMKEITKQADILVVAIGKPKFVDETFVKEGAVVTPSCGLHSQGGVRRGVRASGSSQEVTGKSGSYGMCNQPRGHVWKVFVRPASS